MSGYYSDENKELQQFAGDVPEVKFPLPIGAIFPSAIPLTDIHVHALNGGVISQEGIYAQFAELVKAQVAAGYNISCTQAEFDASVANTGQCGKFVIYGTSIRLPLITKFIEGLSAVTDIGKSNEAGLPNITGNYNNTMQAGNFTVSGAFKDSYGTTERYYSSSTSGGQENGYINFNAANSNSIYGNSDTVQPQSVCYPYYIVLVNGFEYSADVDLARLSQEIRSKTSLDEVYPVGSIYITANNNGSPAKLFGGTWEQIQGKFLLGATDGTDQIELSNLGYSRSSNGYHYWTDASGARHSISPHYPDNYTSVAGEAMHTLSGNEMPAHSHGVKYANNTTGGNPQENFSIWSWYGSFSQFSSAVTRLACYASQGERGGSAAHNNMPPYLVVYMYKRIG